MAGSQTWLQTATEALNKPKEDDWLSNAATTLKARREKKIQTVVSDAVKQPSASIIEARRAAGITGVPADIAERQPEEVGNMAREREVMASLQDTKYLKKAFASPEFARIAAASHKELAGLERSLGDLAGDVGVTAAKGVVGLGSAAIGGLDLVSAPLQYLATGRTGYIGLGAEKLGVDFETTQKILEGMYSEAQLAAIKEVRQASGFTGTLKAAVLNPSVIATTVGESLPQMFAGGAVAKGISSVIKSVPAWLRAATGEGVVAAGASQEQIREDAGTGTTTGKQTLAAGAAGLVTAAFGAAGAKFAQKLGIADIDVVIARGGKLGEAAKEAKGAFFKRVLGAGLSEGVFEELPQSMQEQMWSNFALDKPIFEGVPEAAAMGMLAGVATGGGVGFLHDTVERLSARTATDTEKALGAGLKEAESAAKGQRTEVRLTEIGDVAAQLDLNQSSPETVAEFVQTMAEDTGLTDVYIDSEALTEYAQETGLDMQEFAQSMPEVAEQLAEAGATGGDIRIPMADYVTKIAPTEHNAVFAQHARLDPGDMSAVQAAEWEANYAQNMQERADEILQESAARADTAASSDKVRTTIKQQIMQTGRFDEPTADRYAQLHSSFAVVMGDRLGISPEQVYEKLGLQVTGLETTAEGGYAQGALAGPAFRAAKEEADAMVEADSAGLVDEYLSKHPNIVDPDRVKELFPAYKADPSLAAAVHGASSTMARRIYSEAVKRNKEGGVVFTAGGGGSGKSEAMKVAASAAGVDDKGLVYDSTLKTFSKSVDMIEEALNAGQDVHIVYTHRPVDLAFEFAMQRDRVVPIGVLADAYVESSNNIRRLAEHFADDPRVQITVIDNSGDTPDAMKIGTLADVPEYEYTTVSRRLHERADQALKEGQIDESRRLALGLSEATGKGAEGVQAREQGQELGTGREGAESPVGAEERVDRGPRGDGGISTRVPTAKRATEDPLTRPLKVGLTELRKDPVMRDKLAKLMAGYDNYRPTVSADTPDKVLNRLVTHMKNNLVWLYEQVPADVRERSHLWYDGARAITDRWVERFGVSDTAIAGVMAALSPQKDWFMNVSLAERVLETYLNNRETPWSEEMSATAEEIFGDEKYAIDLAAITGKALAEVAENDLHAAMWVRTYDQAHNDRGHRVVTPEGNFAEFAAGVTGAKKKTGWGSLVEIGKAIAVLRDPSVENISAQMGGNHKVRNFYNSIVAPKAEMGDVTIDTHAVAAALLQPLSGKSAEVGHNFGSHAPKSAKTGLTGSYAVIAEAYRRAAKEVGVLPREMQSITWEAVRGLFSPGYKAQESNVTAVKGLWARYKKGALSLDGARRAIHEHANGIENPSWYGHRPEEDAAGPDSSYLAELPRSRVSGRGENTRDADGRGAGTDSFSIDEGYVLKEVAENGGVTLNSDGTPFSADTGYIATLRTVNVDSLDAAPDALRSFAKENANLLALPDVVIGAFAFGDGQVSIDLNIVTQDRVLAEKIGREMDQISIWDIANEEEIPTGGTSGAGLSNADAAAFIRGLGGVYEEAETPGRVTDTGVAQARLERAGDQTGALAELGGREEAGRVVEYGSTREGAVSVRGVHYSKERRAELDSSFYGTGMRGAEARRIDQSTDERLRKRIYLYADTGDGVTPESSVGVHAHEIQLNNVYDVVADPLDLRAGARGDANAMESAILDAGFDGYYVPEAMAQPSGGTQGAVVLLGQHNVPTGAASEYAQGRAGLEKSGVWTASSVDETSEAFRRWSGGGEVVEPEDVNDHKFEAGKPTVLKVFHGTTHEFSVFEALRGNLEGQFGAINYFTSSERDASDNYAGEGPDLTLRIESRAEQLSQELEDQFAEKGRKEVLRSLYRSLGDLTFVSSKMAGMDDTDAAFEAGKAIASHELSGGQENTMELYVRTDNPFVIGGQASWIELVNLDGVDEQAVMRVAEEHGIEPSEVEANRDKYEDEIAEARWDIEADEPNILAEAVRAVSSRHDVDAAGLFNRVYELEDAAKPADIEELMRTSEDYIVAQGETGTLIGNQLLAEVIKEMGFDSIILRNADERFKGMDIDPGTAHVHVFDSDKTNIKSVENIGTFDPTNPDIYHQARRGKISLPEDMTKAPSVISLFEKADLSTMLHESGHFFFDVYRNVASQSDAPEQVRKDMQALLDFVGVSSLEEWNKMSQEERRAGHEKVAEAFEVYLFEGKAPSNELKSLFRTFRNWLTDVYRTAKQYLAPEKITPEVRGVFDRMLAVQDQIDETRREDTFRPLFESAGEAGMSESEYASYNALDRARQDDALNELDRRSLRDMKWLENAKSRELKKLQREAKEVRDQVKQDITDEVYAMPIYRVRRFLSHGELPADMDLNQEQRRSFTEAGMKSSKLSTEALQELYGTRANAKWRHMPTGKYGWHAIGGLDPQFVAEAFDFESVDEMIDKLLEAPKPDDLINDMTDEYMLKEHGDLVDEDALNEAANKALHNEAHRRMVATELKRLGANIGPVSVLNRAAKQYAETKIGGQRVKDVKPKQFRAAERRAAKKAMEALGRGDQQAAIQAKRDQVLSGHLQSAAETAVEDIRKGLNYLKRFDSEGTRKKLDRGYLDQIDSVLERFDLRKGTSLKEIAKRTSLNDWLASQEEQGIQPDLPDHIRNEAARTHYKMLTTEEFRGLVDSVKQIEHIARFKHKLLTAKERRGFNDTVNAMGDKIRETAKGGAKPIAYAPEGDVSAWISDFFAGHRKLNSLFRQFDGGEDGGLIWEILGRTMNERGDYESVANTEATRKLTELYAPLLKMKGGLNGDKRYIKELDASLPRQSRLAVALNMGNSTNRQRLMDGNGWTEDQLNAVLRTLTAEEANFVNKIWSFINGYWGEISDKEHRVTGTRPEKVEAEPFVAQIDGDASFEFDGGYYPLVADKRRDKKAEAREDAEQGKDIMRGAFTRATTRRGHTKARVEQAAYPVSLELSVVTRHVAQVIHDLAWHEWLIDANRIVGSSAFDSAVRGHYGPATIRTIKDALKGIAVGDLENRTAMDRLMLHLRANVSRSTMGLSLTTMMLQPFGLAQSVVRIGPKYVLRGARHWAGDVAKFENSMKWISEKSAFMRKRNQTFNRELNELNNRVSKGHSKTRSVYDKILFAPMQKMQLIADIPTWIGMYEKALDQGESEDRAAALADQAVLDSQGSGQTKDLAEFQRKHPFLTMFYSYFNTTYNLTVESTAKTNFREPLAVAGWMSDMLMLLVVPAILPAMILSMLRGEDWEDWEAEEWVAKLAEWEAGYMLGLMLGLREMSGSVQGFDYSGPPVGRVLTEMNRLGKQVGQGEADEALALAAVRFFGTALGLPTTQLVRSYRGWSAWLDDEAPPSSTMMGPPPKE